MARHSRHPDANYNLPSNELCRSLVLLSLETTLCPLLGGCPPIHRWLDPSIWFHGRQILARCLGNAYLLCRQPYDPQLNQLDFKLVVRRCRTSKSHCHFWPDALTWFDHWVRDDRCHCSWGGRRLVLRPLHGQVQSDYIRIEWSIHGLLHPLFHLFQRKAREAA